LERATVQASGQAEKILRFFQQHPRTAFTPWDVHLHLGQQLMITSVRRAITTLTDAGHLVKTEERRKSGPADETNCTWKLKITFNQ
jgi:Fe2+ or Zn2+ uptake regulation protein